MTKFEDTVRDAFPEFVEDFDTIEAESAGWAQRFHDAEASVQHGLRRARTKQRNNVELLVGISAAGLATRVRQLADGLAGLVNENNPHAAPPVARALFEACCLPVYLERELLPRLRKGRTNAVHVLVFRLGLGGGGALGGHVKPIAVDALISSARAELKAMEEKLPQAERINAEELIDIYYGPLSELTHPNWAALTLGTEMSFPPRFTSPAAFDGGVMHAVVGSSAYIMSRGGRALDEVLSVLGTTPMDLPNRDPDWRGGEIRSAEE